MQALRKDQQGATLVEFALLLPVMLLMICGTIELGVLIFTRISLEGALTDAARGATATMEESEDERDVELRKLVNSRMEAFPKQDGKEVDIRTTVFADFGSSHPENFTDKNGNGKCDPVYKDASGKDVVEFDPATDDRNGNGKWDAAIPKEGKLGGPGDVVSYTAVFPARTLFSFLASMIGTDNLMLTATTVVRNEPVKRKALS